MCNENMRVGWKREGSVDLQKVCVLIGSKKELTTKRVPGVIDYLLRFNILKEEGRRDSKLRKRPKLI